MRPPAVEESADQVGPELASTVVDAVPLGTSPTPSTADESGHNGTTSIAPDPGVTAPDQALLGEPAPVSRLEPGHGEGAAEASGVLGTADASISSLMKAAVETPKFAEFAGQELPADSGVRMERDTAAESRAHGLASDRDSAAVPFALGLATVTLPVGNPGSPEAATAPGGTRTDSAALRLSEQVEGAVVRFRQHGEDELEVTIRPDSRTEIRLHLSGRDGVPHVRADLLRGDAAWFESRWNELEQRLRQQGVAAQSGWNGAGSSAGSGSDRRSNSRTERSSEGSLSVARRLRPSGTVESGETRPTRRGNGWETWA